MFPLLLIAFLLLTPAWSQTSTVTADHEAVVAIVDRYSTAREGEDATTLETLFTDSADQLVSSGEWRRGKPELIQGMLASSRANPGGRTVAVETVVFLRPDVAIANARYEIGGTANRAARRMWSTFVCVREDGTWRIAAIRNMLPAQ